MSIILKVIERQAAMYRSVDENSAHLLMLENKALLLSRTKIATSVYIISLIVINLLKFIPFEYWFVGQQPSEFVLFAYIIWLIVILKPRENNGFIYNFSELIPFYNFEQIVLNRLDRNNVAPVRHWDLSKTVLIEWPTQKRSKISIGIEEDYTNQMSVN